MLQCQRVITENNQGGETVWPGVQWPGTFLGKVVIIRKLLYLHIRMVQQISGLNKGRASSLSLITRAGFMARLLKVNQAPRHLPHHGSAPSSKARIAARHLIHTAGCRRKGVRRRSTCLPFRKCLEVAHTLCLPIHWPARSHMATPTCQGDWETEAVFWGPVKTQALYHLELRDDTGRYQTVLAMGHQGRLLWGVEQKSEWNGGSQASFCRRGILWQRRK